jgi:hypothetical protein
MDILQIFFVIILIIALTFVIAGGAWWIILWSFNFPIVFSWKQVIGLWILTLLFNSSATYNRD